MTPRPPTHHRRPPLPSARAADSDDDAVRLGCVCGRALVCREAWALLGRGGRGRVGRPGLNQWPWQGPGRLGGRILC